MLFEAEAFLIENALRRTTPFYTQPRSVFDLGPRSNRFVLGMQNTIHVYIDRRSAVGKQAGLRFCTHGIHQLINNNNTIIPPVRTCSASAMNKTNKKN